MTKQDFIKEAQALGFKKYKDLVKELGYHERHLDRFKKIQDLPQNIIDALSKHKTKNTQLVVGETPNEGLKETVIAYKPEPTPSTTTIKTQHTENTTQENNTQETQSKEIGIDISNDEYHASGIMSVSKLKTVIDNSKEYYHRHIKKDLPFKETDALIIGKLHHTLIMEPHKLDEEYIILDIPQRAIKDDLVKAAKVLDCEFSYKEVKGEVKISNTIDQLKELIDEKKKESKKTIGTKTQFDIAKRTSESALESIFEWEVKGETLLKASLRDLLSLPTCYVEKSFYGVIEGVEVQIRPDILINLGTSTPVWIVIDPKSIEVATTKMFIRQGSEFFWDMQEAVYTEILRQNGIHIKNFYFNAAGKKEFSGAGFFEWAYTSKEDAKKVMIAAIRKYKYCTENNIFLEGKFNYKEMKFEAVSMVEVATYRQYQMGDLGV